MGQDLSIIIICSDTTGPNMIQNALALSPKEVIVVLTENKEASKIRQFANKNNCTIVGEKDPSKNMGYREAIKKAKGDTLLILDGNNIYQKEQIHSFLSPIQTGQAQVVLSNLTPSFLQKQAKQWPDAYTLWRQILNDCLGYRHLTIDSLLTVPHAFTQEVVQTIGYESFKNLASAQVLILEHGFKISRVTMSSTPFPGNLYSPKQSHYSVPLNEPEIHHMEKHMEALALFLKMNGKRGGYHDGGRQRDIVKQLKRYKSVSEYTTENPSKAHIIQGRGMHSTIYNGKQLSVIIPAQNEETTIAAAIQEARKLEPCEIIVVVNGSSDQTEKISIQLGATVITFHEALGHDIGRAVGALEAKGDILLFVDADFSIPAKYLHPFCLSISKGNDVALNDLNLEYFPLYVVNLYKYMLNTACRRKELGVGSLIAVPHALSRACLEGIGWDSLQNPCLAHVKSILQGFKISNVQFVDVMQPNRIRPDQHFSNTGYPKAVLRITGDHLEALAHLLDTQ
jgi:hypothetical protein